MAESRAKQAARADQVPAQADDQGVAVPGGRVTPSGEPPLLQDVLAEQLREQVDGELEEMRRDLRMAVDAIQGLAGRVEKLEGGLGQVGASVQEGLAAVMEQLSSRIQALAPVPGAQEEAPTGDQLAAMAAEVGWLRGCVRLLSQAIGVRLPPSPDRSPLLDEREAAASLVVHAGGEGGTVGPGVVFGSG